MRLPILVLHICAGILGLVSGAAAISFRKGSRRHGIAGNVFVIFTMSMSTDAAYLALMKHQMNNVFGVHRIARHLCRMCFSLFIATGSFFLAQQQVFPHWLRKTNVLFLPAILPLILLIFWLFRVLFTNTYKGTDSPYRVHEDRAALREQSLSG